MYNPFRLHPGANGHCLVCHSANCQRPLAGCLFCLLLPAAIFNLFYRRRLGRPLQPQTADYPLRRPDCSRHPAYVPYYAVSDQPTAAAWRTAGNVCYPLPGSRCTNTRRKCGFTSAGTSRTAYALQRAERRYAIRGKFCRPSRCRSSFKYQQPAHNTAN